MKKHELESLAEEIETMGDILEQLPDVTEFEMDVIDAIDHLRVKAFSLVAACEGILESFKGTGD